MTRLTPVLETTEFLSKQKPGFVISHEELAKRLDVSRESKRFDFDLMAVRERLFSEHGIVFSSGGKSCRILTEEEKLTQESPRLEARVANALRRKASMEARIDESQLDDRAKRLLERNMQRTAVLTAAFGATRRLEAKTEGSASEVLLRLLDRPKT